MLVVPVDFAPTEFPVELDPAERDRLLGELIANVRS